MHEFRNCELLSGLEALRLPECGLILVGAVDAFTLSTMPADDATADNVESFTMPAEFTGTGEIIDGKPHVHGVMAVEGHRAIAGHLHAATIGTHFVRAYVAGR